MANTTKHAITSWDTFHNNGSRPAKTLYKTSLEGKGNMPSVIDRYNDVALEIQRLLQETMDAGEGFRAYGSAWSMSHIAHQKDNMHFNAAMNLKMAITANELHANAVYQHENLFFFQCGNVIKEVSRFVSDHGKSLKATGASNGQTIAGCISTGVHGSALDVGAVQDSVVGFNLIIGPGANDIVYIERHTRPALSDAFANQLKARVIRNDGLFNAALVGLGGFGFVHGVVMETEPRFLLQRYARKIPVQQALTLAETMDFENAAVIVPGETDPAGKPLRPFHYKIFINPYVQTDPEYPVEVIYKKPYRNDYPDPIPRIETAIYRDLIILFTKIAGKFKNSIPKLIKVLQTSVLPDTSGKEDTIGTLAETFWDAPHQGPAYACAVGIDHRDSPRALQLLTELARTEGPVPGLFAMRFVKKSSATLAFTRFPITCMLEIDGVIWKPKGGMISLLQFSTRIVQALQQNNIPFTIHWGKNADWSFPGLVQHMYGDDAETWKQYRSALLGRDAAKLFSNGFLDDTGLSEFKAAAPVHFAETVAP